ncbi:MAG: 3-deoxy-manno-octulosonate cytidylyltransferase [Sandaracinaceae bacterium]
MSVPFTIVIPARLRSERLPDKPLADLAGAPLVVRVWERAMAADAAEVWVAVDDASIADACAAHGASAVMTSPDCASGTDRLAEVARARGWDEDTIVVNLQGDEPLVPIDLAGRLARALSDDPGVGVSTAAAPIRAAVDLATESIVKVVCDARGRALYFSRAPIPWVRGRAPDAPLPDDVPFLRHVGVYAYRVGTLLRLAGAERSPLERAESLEQLRAMHLGIPIAVVRLDEAPPHGVDTPDDLARVRAIFERGPTS